MNKIISRPNKMGIGVSSENEVVIEFTFGPKVVRVGLAPDQSALLRGELANAEKVLEAGGTTKQ